MQRSEAIKIYNWLWFAPFVTVPTIIFLSIVFYFMFDNGFVGAFLVSSGWHLVLIVQVLQQQDKYVRWHGKQALVLAGFQTTVPLFYIVSYLTENMDEFELFGFIFPLGIVWLFGTLWGQGQAKQGVCTLMKLFGEDAPIDTETAKTLPKPIKQNPDDLENIVRYSKDNQKRANAIYGLMQLGMVESFDGSPPPNLTVKNLETLVTASQEEPSKPGGCLTPLLWVGGILLILFFLCRFYIAF